MIMKDIVFLSEPIETIPWVLQMLFVSLAYLVLGRKEKREPKRQKSYGRLALEEGALLLLLVAGSLLIMGLVSGMFTLVWNMYLAAVLLAYLYFFSGYRFATKMVLFCSAYASMQILSSMVGNLSFLMGNLVGKGMPEAITRPMVSLLAVVIAFYLTAYDFDEFEDIPMKGMLLILVGDVALLINSAVESVYFLEDTWANVRVIILCVSLLAMVLFSVYVLYTICRDHENMTLMREREQQLLNERERFSQAEQQMEQIRSIRHDLKNQNHYLRILLQEERYDDMKHYFEQIEGNLPTVMNYVSCGNKSVDVILNMEFAKIDSGIHLEHLLVVPPKLPFRDEELCSVISNLIDNALEECRHLLEAGENPSIYFEICTHAGLLSIVCRNTTDKKKLNSWRSGLISTKTDKTQHGYGTQIVSRIAEKYDGLAEYSLQNGEFVAKVIMDMMGGQDYAESRAV